MLTAHCPPHIRTWWGNPPMFPSTRVGWSGLSCFSLAICGPGVHGCRAGPITRMARTTSRSNSCSTVPSSPWSCPGAALWKLGVQKLYAPSPTPILYVGLAANVLGRVPLMPLCRPGLLGNSGAWQLYSDHPTPAPPAPERQVSTSAGRCSRRVGQERKQRLVPTCTRSTNGCGSLGGSNSVWGACRWLRLRRGA